MTSLFVSLFAGAIGIAYMVYGKRQTKFVPMVSGLLLCIYPYLFDNPVWLLLAGGLLLAAPFVFDF